MMETEGERKKGFEDATLQALKTEGKDHEYKDAKEPWKTKRSRKQVLVEPSEGTQPLGLISDFQAPDL